MQKACQCERCPEIYIRKALFYIKKKSQSDYIISSLNSQIGSFSRPYMVLKDVLWSQWSRDHCTLSFNKYKKARQSMVIDGLLFVLEMSR